jgi:hypothetical protein
MMTLYSIQLKLKSSNKTVKLILVPFLTTLGGIWINMDTFFINDWYPLLHQEFMVESTCSVDRETMSPQVFSMFKDSPLSNYVSDKIKSSDLTKGFKDFNKKLRISVLKDAQKLYNVTVYPCCFFSPEVCTPRGRKFQRNLESFFELDIRNNETFIQTFSYIWHESVVGWSTLIEKGFLFTFLL